MYRDDYEATYAKLQAAQRELTDAQSQAHQDKARIAVLVAQLQAAQQALASHGAMMPGRYVLPSRGGSILALGICSLVLCSILGPIAWSMGNEELRRIDSGQTPMDGRGLASAGRICGIISSVLLICGALFFVMVIGLSSMAWH